MGIISDKEDSIENTQSDGFFEKIIAFENGELTQVQVLELFSYLIRAKLVWKLPGNYGRTANSLIEAGLIEDSGEINWEMVEPEEQD
ncbi:DUF7417 domain-containing protein [Dermacoccus nishinomiyaensis]|uniref:DUF7417 domain-containing protein n=1 Tax=Dermacoccus nishinomiyaensis TaxID=1274 RepID=UPI00248EDC2B|nr:hypothetical protein [Dermacoccus nishinomiyaensis]